MRAAAGRDPGGGSAPGGVALGPGREFELIRDLLRGSTGRSGSAGSAADAPEWLRVGPGDDCAVLDAGPLAVSCDLAIEGIHFRRAWLRPEETGWRAAAAALSDLAASAAEPLGVLVALGIPEDLPLDEVRRISDGVGEAAASVGARILGGDVTRSPGPLVLDVIALGRAPRPVLRRGARPGDEVWVTGRLGGAGAAVRAWEAGEEPAPALRAAYARPRPRTGEALWLVEETEVRALIDLSDGLAGDAGHLAAASGVAVVLEADRIPLLAEVPPHRDRLSRALTDGDDYELCLAAPAGAIDDALADDFHESFGVALTRVGRVEEGEGVALEGGDGSRRPAGRGFDHLASTPRAYTPRDGSGAGPRPPREATGFDDPESRGGTET